MKSNRYAFCFVFNSVGQVLVLKRADFMRGRPGEWDLPGGKIEEGEAKEDGATREVLEETGLTITKLEIIISRAGEWDGVTYDFTYYRAHANSEEIILSEEHTEAEWHDPLVASTMVAFRPHKMGFEVEKSQNRTIV